MLNGKSITKDTTLQPVSVCLPFASLQTHEPLATAGPPHTLLTIAPMMVDKIDRKQWISDINNALGTDFGTAADVTKIIHKSKDDIILRDILLFFYWIFHGAIVCEQELPLDDRIKNQSGIFKNSKLNNIAMWL